jgi:hypothetical protein
MTARNQRLFIGVYPTGIVYADRHVETRGEYKRLAFMPYDTLDLRHESVLPDELIGPINSHAGAIRAKRGQRFTISASGQTVLLGSRAA